jgi:hypothetical protein
MKPKASVKKKSKSDGSSRRTSLKRPRKSRNRFVLCIHNDGYPASLELRKIYHVLPDAAAAKENLMRVIDESGEDYLIRRTFL